MVIDGIPAGTVLADMGFYCQDEAGNPVHSGMHGKVQMSWCRGSKKVVLEEGVVCLPDLLVSGLIWHIL